jgi:hypothetical protein
VNAGVELLAVHWDPGQAGPQTSASLQNLLTLYAVQDDSATAQPFFNKTVI